jgi:tyrosyl-tRNA synthetase
MDLYGELAWRALVYDATDGLRDLLARERLTLYSGFDPTAASLHVGHMLPIMTLARAQRLGHTPIALIGGGTGLIGDPSGKSAERVLQTTEQVETNVAGIRPQLARFLDFDSKSTPARLVNNADWLTKLSAIDFMRDVGKHFTVNAMLAKESVKRRIESEDGISYTEFSYSLLQAYDFLVLHERFNCTLQIGGSDQWGNIVAGMDLIRRVRAGKAHGLVMPLLTTASGAKFGKTEGGAVWLDPQLTSPYEFYQFWFNTDDRDAVKYLKFFTFLDARRIAELESAGASEPDKRLAQRELAREVTRLVHDDAGVAQAEAHSAIAFAGAVTTADLKAIAEKVIVARAEFAIGVPLTHLLVRAELAVSNSEGARLVRGGGVSVNGAKITDERLVLTLDTPWVAAGIFRIERGKKQRAVVEVGE